MNGITDVKIPRWAKIVGILVGTVVIVNALTGDDDDKVSALSGIRNHRDCIEL